MSDTLVIIPTYNEKENAEPMAKAVLAACPEADLLFVDDNSPDGTGELVARLAAENPRIHVLHRQQKQGLGRAYVAGFRWALERPDYRFIMEMDADFSHDPQAVPQLRAVAQNADLVLGSRYVGGLRVINWPLNPDPELGRRALCSLDHGHAVLRSHGRIQVLPARGAGGDQPGRDSCQRLFLSDRNDAHGLAPGIPDRGIPDHFRGTARRTVEDERRHHQ